MSLHFGPDRATFIHIPKCAGTSVKQWARRLPHTRSGPKHIKSNRAKTIFRNHGKFFTIVRNPYDRAVSLFHFCGQLGNGEIKMGGSRPLCYDVWRDLYSDGLHAFLIEIQNHNSQADTQDGNWHMWDSQWSWINGAEDAVILRYEQLDQQFAIIQDLVGCHEPLPLVNKSEHDHYETYLDTESKKLIQRIWAEDFERFGYSV